MPALTPVVDSLDKVPESARTFYEPKDGKFHVILDAAPAGFVPAAELATANGKVVEFRDNNIKLVKEVEELRPLKTKYAGIEDPEAAKAAITELAALKAKGITKPDDISTQITAAVKAAQQPLLDEVASMKASSAADRKRADDATLRQTISEHFTKAGGIPSALDFIVTKASSVFQVESGAVKAQANRFSSEKPGDPLTVEEWLKGQVKESDFAFKLSNGGGADPLRTGGGGGGGLKPGQILLKDPTPQQLGQHADAIRKGTMKVEYSADQRA